MQPMQELGAVQTLEKAKASLQCNNRDLCCQKQLCMMLIIPLLLVLCKTADLQAPVI